MTQLQTATRLSGWQEQKPKGGADEKKQLLGENEPEHKMINKHTKVLDNKKIVILSLQLHPASRGFNDCLVASQKKKDR